jgi:hypothetical protein
MSTHDRRPFDNDLTEVLLGAAGSSSAARRLTERLAVTVVPALTTELVGEQRAVAVFRAAVALTPPTHVRRPSMIKTTLAKLLTLKAAAILAGVSAGGVALAATTGVLPNPLTQDPPAPAHATASPGNPGQGNPSPSLQGLCTAYLAGAGSDHGKALESPAFQALITAAGDAQSVDSFCATLAVSPSNSASTDHPTGAPTTHPTGPENTHAPAQPTPHATNVPTPTVTQTPTHP